MWYLILFRIIYETHSAAASYPLFPASVSLFLPLNSHSKNTQDTSVKDHWPEQFLVVGWLVLPGRPRMVWSWNKTTFSALACHEVFVGWMVVKRKSLDKNIDERMPPSAIPNQSHEHWLTDCLIKFYTMTSLSRRPTRTHSEKAKEREKEGGLPYFNHGIVSSLFVSLLLLVIYNVADQLPILDDGDSLLILSGWSTKSIQAGPLVDRNTMDEWKWAPTLHRTKQQPISTFVI